LVSKPIGPSLLRRGNRSRRNTGLTLPVVQTNPAMLSKSGNWSPRKRPKRRKLPLKNAKRLPRSVAPLRRSVGPLRRRGVQLCDVERQRRGAKQQQKRVLRLPARLSRVLLLLHRRLLLLHRRRRRRRQTWLPRSKYFRHLLCSPSANQYK
jgi:hypothetical protein